MALGWGGERMRCTGEFRWLGTMIKRLSPPQDIVSIKSVGTYILDKEEH